MKPECEAAVITDAILTAVVRCEIWRSARPEVVRQLADHIDELGDTRGGPVDAYETMMIDVLSVLRMHLEYLGGAETSRAVPVKVDVMKDLRDYAHLARKVAHGCTDAGCAACDSEYGKL